MKLSDLPFASPELKKHYEFQMDRYAASGKGILFVLPATNKYGDFASAPEYTWSPSAQCAWRDDKILPAQPSDLAETATLVTWTYHTAHVRRQFDGDIRITPGDFKRLEATIKATASMWQVLPDCVALIPKPAIAFTEEQKHKYRDGSYTDRNAPCMRECLQPGFRPQDVRMSADGTPVMTGPWRPTAITAKDLVDSL